MSEQGEREAPTPAELQPIIVKRSKAAAHGHHGGAWKVAYADMVTALMALFIVLWILGQSEEVKHEIAAYFRDPVGYQDGGSATPLAGDSGASVPSPVPSVIPGPAPAAGWADEVRGIRAVLLDFENFRDQVELEHTSEGLRITLLESRETPLFEVGGTNFQQAARELIGALASRIASLPHRIVIEGHTDGLGYRGKSEVGNWELSAGRANTARRLMVAAGIPDERFVEVRGLADRQPYDTSNPADSRNRRVAFTLLSHRAFMQRSRVARPVSRTVR